MPSLYIGTSAFTAVGWEGSFYPKGAKPADFLSYYARHFNSVEIDSTFYRCPSASTVRGWASKTPDGFVFAAKVPQVITHEKVLVDCDAEFKEFLDTMELLGDKLGPLLLQFSYFNKKAFVGVNDFLARLRPFLKKLPKGRKFAVEIRNKNWLVPQFVETLRERNVALALVDHVWLPRPKQLFERFDPITTDFTYVRWLGDRKGIEEQTKTWDRVIVDRKGDLQNWVELLRRLVLDKRIRKIIAFMNNHYSGHAPAGVKLFQQLWDDHR